MKNIVAFSCTLLLAFCLNAQSHTHTAKKLSYPDITGFVTLKTDLHQHTVFSDGNVWPTIRVMEALRDNLDVISLTEHLEYQPHKADIPHPDRNRSFELALNEAKDHDLIIINGSEITRSAPIGHNNAIFITDANKILAKDATDAFKEAKKQEAFVFWNHPAWYAQSPKGTPILSDFQKERIQKGELQGIEVINSIDYSEEALALALAHNLTIMGTSDIHGLIDWDYTEKGNSRPITLVFAETRDAKSIKAALFAGRTVAVYNALLVGKPEYVVPLIHESIVINTASYLDNTAVLEVELENISSSDLLFENEMPYTFYNSAPVFTVPAGGKYVLQIKTLEKLSNVNLKLKALGAYVAPKQHPIIDWKIMAE
tara:strand:+ start:5138 stop:6250 length:1113 start_codon:yes stop_codon:yes gene_type:complete